MSNPPPWNDPIKPPNGNFSLEERKWREGITRGLNNIKIKSLGDIGDVDLTSPSANEILKFDGSNWVNGTPSVTVTNWGDIVGSLSNQTDLQNALNAKADLLSLALVATSGDYDDLIDKPFYNGAELNKNNPNFYGTSSSAATDVTKIVSIPSITKLEAGQVIIVKPDNTSTVASSKLQLNSFTAYSMRYNGSAITTSTDSIVWNANYPTLWLFDGTYWVFLAHGVDSNTTYTLNYSIDAGQYVAGSGSYAITRYSLILQKPNQTWEKVTATSSTYSTGTSKSANTNGFLLGQIRYYSSTTTLANGTKAATNVVYNKSSSIDLRYSTNCGGTPTWTAGQYIYLVGSIGVDGLFYLDTTKWWDNALPTTNDGKLYIRLGIVITDSSYSISLLDDRPIYYHDGVSLRQFGKADNKQDLITANNKLDYSLIANTPSIPTVYDATLTIQKNGTSVGTFTANANTDVTLNITETIQSASSPLSISSNALSISQASSTTDGYLSSSDWTTFNSKLSSTIFSDTNTWTGTNTFSGLTVTGNIITNANDTYSIGDATNRFNLYAQAINAYGSSYFVNLYPSSDNTYKLGNDSAYWSQLYARKIYTGTGTGIYFSSEEGKSYIKDVTGNTLELHATASINFKVGDSIRARLGTTTFRPETNNAYDLGDSSHCWRTIYSVNPLNTSDRRIKNNIENLENGLRKINSIAVKSYTINNHNEGVMYGFIAQDELERNPELVVVPDNYSEEEGGGELGYMPNNVLFLAVKAIQELSAKVTALENKLESLGV